MKGGVLQLIDEYYQGYYAGYDYTKLQYIDNDQARGGNKRRLNECFIMVDTETSKSAPDVWHWSEKKRQRVYDINHNYVVKWSIAISAWGHNICCLYGSRPSDLMKTIEKIHKSMTGTHTIFYIHNLAYDYVFLRKFLFRAFGHPVKQLNTKPHYPVSIEFENGIIFRDSLILSQRSIEKWANDMDVEHKKSVGKWDYDKIRHQSDDLTSDEIDYICNDVLAGVECLSKLRMMLHKTYSAMPYTATGIVRAEARNRGDRFNAQHKAAECYTNLYDYKMLEHVYHGGFTHANRHVISQIIREEDIGDRISCYDFASSYPYTMISEKFPIEKFTYLNYDPDPDEILNGSEGRAYIFRVRVINIRLKQYEYPMPPLQLSKVTNVCDAVIDNGRIIKAGYVDIYLNDIDFAVIYGLYDFDKLVISHCMTAKKDYLPRWFTDYVYELYRDKTMLKNGDHVLYNLTKAMLNSLYGMSVQKLMKDDILEDFDTGEYNVEKHDTEDDFLKAVKKRSLFLFYAWGVYVTSYAMRNLFRLGECFDYPVYDWFYSDTDSVYGCSMNRNKLDAYNDAVRARLIDRGYPGIEHDGRSYWLGVAEPDGEYTEFVTNGAKRYAKRDINGELYITVAGVPKKKGAKVLEDDINNFRSGLIFPGEVTGKKTHVYQYVDEIFTNEYGDEVGDSINLIPCDYLLDQTMEHVIDGFMFDEIQLQIYDEEE